LTYKVHRLTILISTWPNVASKLFVSDSDKRSNGWSESKLIRTANEALGVWWAEIKIKYNNQKGLRYSHRAV
jgi:hypothetical protein